MAYRAGAYTLIDVSMGVIVTIVAIEAARRVLGWGMAMCAVLPIVYALFGNYLPFLIGHRGFTMRRVIEYVYLTSDGIFGVMADVVASFIIPFVVFGAFMEIAGVAKFFVDLSLAALGRITGGPAQAAVISSLFMGTVSGSPIAETVTNGHGNHTADEDGRLSAAHRGGGGRSGVHRGDDHAARHGRRRVHHGRDDQHPVP